MISIIMLLLVSLLVGLACLGFIIFTIFHLFFWIKSGTPFLPSHKKLLEKIEKEIDWSRVMTFYDLGSGNGDVVKFFASRHSHIDFIGYEMNPLRVLRSRWMSRRLGNTRFESCDFLKKDLGGADLVFTFLLPEVMDKTLPKLKKEMKSGSILVSNTFHFSDKDFQPEKTIDPGKEKQFQTLYIFKF